MKIALCDDEKFWIDELRVLLEEYHTARHTDYYMTVFSSGKELLKSSDRFDVIFMDYQMKELNGIETSRKIRMRNNGCAIIFVSSYPDIALDTFEVDAYRFLTKPINKDKLFKSLDDYRKQTETDDFIVLKSRDGEKIVRSSEVVLCEADGKHSLLHTMNETIHISKNIREIEKLLTKDTFFRCHKAYIVSFFHIKTFDNSCIVMNNGKKAYISRNNLTSFKTAFQEYVLRYNMGRI